MILKIENLGVVKQVELDLRKPFTLFCGQNSTGKTYVSYLLQAFLDESNIFPFPKYQNIINQVAKQGYFVLDKGLLETWIAENCRFVTAQLGVIFGIPEETRNNLFSNTSISAFFSDDDYSQALVQEVNIAWQQSSSFNKVAVKKEANSDKVYIESTDSIETNVRPYFDVLFNIIHKSLYGLVFITLGSSTMLTVERNSIYTFKTELSLNRNELIDRIQQNSEKKGFDIIDFLSSSSRRYPLSVTKSLRIANDLETVKKQTSIFAEVADMIENKLLLGKVAVTKTGDVEFRVSKKKGRLPFHLSSSIVKTMASLVVYLRHLAKVGDTLIIDEPEMNFHPDVQVSLTHIFAILAKKGLRLVISTHSDYIVRELNNLIMAYAINQQGNSQLIKEQGYKSDMLLDHKSVDVLFFERKRSAVTVRPLPIDEKGFVIDTIDKTINEQNRVAEILYASFD